MPYRDSKLTRLLRDSLGGNTRSMIIVTLRCEPQNVDEAIATLRFAQRAKAVKTVVKDNTVTTKNTSQLLKEIDSLEEKLNTSSLMVRQLQAELERMTREQDEEVAKHSIAIA